MHYIFRYYEIGTVLPIIKRQKDLLPVALLMLFGMLVLVSLLPFSTKQQVFYLTQTQSFFKQQIKSW